MDGRNVTHNTHCSHSIITNGLYHTFVPILSKLLIIIVLFYVRQFISLLCIILLLSESLNKYRLIERSFFPSSTPSSAKTGRHSDRRHDPK